MRCAFSTSGFMVNDLPIACVSYTICHRILDHELLFIGPLVAYYGSIRTHDVQLVD
jgi:hypothetical protein